MSLQRDAGLLSVGNPNGFETNPLAEKPITLADAGIDKNLADRAHCPASCGTNAAWADRQPAANCYPKWGTSTDDKLIRLVVAATALLAKRRANFNLGNSIGYSAAIHCLFRPVQTPRDGPHRNRRSNL